MGYHLNNVSRKSLHTTTHLYAKKKYIKIDGVENVRRVKQTTIIMHIV